MTEGRRSDDRRSGPHGRPPDGRKVESGVVGRPQNFFGEVNDGLGATDERIASVRKRFREARVEEFEQVGRKAWHDRSSGTEYRTASGNPLLGTADGEIACFLIDGEQRLVFLKPAADHVESKHLGDMSGLV